MTSNILQEQECLSSWSAWTHCFDSVLLRHSPIFSELTLPRVHVPEPLLVFYFYACSANTCVWALFKNNLSFCPGGLSLVSRILKPDLATNSFKLYRINSTLICVTFLGLWESCSFEETFLFSLFEDHFVSQDKYMQRFISVSLSSRLLCRFKWRF